MGLSTQQELALGAGVELVEACPGAGKTRAIVARFRQQAKRSVRGVALLSFTNAAIDEATQRCSDEPQLLHAPNFVGTFDSFIHRYIVTPELASTLGKAPTYFQDWRELLGDLHEVRMGAGAGISISNFMHDSNGTIVLLPDKLPNAARRYYEGMSDDLQRQRLKDRGVQRIKQMTDRGVFDSNAARAKALEILGSVSGKRRLGQLANRFSEIIVDEFQDCAGKEHELLALLRIAGIHVVAVGDPDQAIYEFRQADLTLYALYRAQVEDHAIVRFETNYRSSPPICELVASLASSPSCVVNSGMIAPQTAAATIYIVSGKLELLRPKFIEVCSNLGIPKAEQIALAHRLSEAMKLATSSKPAPTGNKLVRHVIVDLRLLRISDVPAVRKKALSRLEKLVLEQFDWDTAQSQLSKEERLLILGMTKAWLRSVVGQLVVRSRTWDAPETCRSSVKEWIEQGLSGLPIAVRANLGARIHKPDSKIWEYWQDLQQPTGGSNTVAWSTIHGAKGKEFDAVLLKAPSNAAIDDWLGGMDSEERRVFYVGASRARRLLMIAVSQSRVNTVKAAFDTKKIAYFHECIR